MKRGGSWSLVLVQFRAGEILQARSDRTLRRGLRIPDFCLLVTDAPFPDAPVTFSMRVSIKRCSVDSGGGNEENATVLHLDGSRTKLDFGIPARYLRAIRKASTSTAPANEQEGPIFVKYCTAVV